MKLLINGKEEIVSFMGETLGDLLSHIETKGVAQGNVIRSMKINGQESSADSSVVRKTPFSEIKILEIEISTLSGIINKNIDNADAYLIRLIPGIEKSVELFRMGNEQEANKFFINIIDGIDWLSQVLDMILAAKAISPDTVFGGKSIQDRRTSLVGFTQQMVDANKNQDWVLLADLLEYEILPYYQEWSELLPHFRSE
ncbi:MAG: hypothetical protein HOB32_07960 [Nitrospina sp.]|jgi:hypothetical protein|nr:hypothetical protein [Nitrospina sp.]MBT6601576.1 hypothetical protein [Nitrospina sp.]